MSADRDVDTVTGAFGYIGRSIARALLEEGRRVRTITTHPTKPNPFGRAVEAHPYGFEDPARLAATLEGTDTLYNTYWIRFPYGRSTRRSRTRAPCSAARGRRECGASSTSG